MVTLLSPLQIETRDGRFILILWLCQMFDEHYSFRDALSNIERALGSATHELPREYQLEDFVDGLFRWGSRQFDLYYERSLGYLQFSSQSSSDLEALHAALSPITRVTAKQKA
jgi:hypothetical protein